MILVCHRPLLLGNRLEVEWLSGAVARLGLEAQIPTPINRTIYAALRLYAEGGIVDK
ncbi:MAG: hypothetical protein KDI47_10405 [Gammaproteobacteria bacterium]|nr:hypothetical protein [Gammaproteobacteria bacterium]MCB1862125.1 hypothetical protein [Gammaproteobacteria bacterium]